MKRWKIVYEKYCRAIEKIYSSVQEYVPYTLVCDRNEDKEFNMIFIRLDSAVDGYKIDVKEADGENQSIVIVAGDEINLLYAAADFKNIYLPYAKYKNCDNVYDFYHSKPFNDTLRPFSYASKPRIRQRGLWTWGHTIYDYKKYIDNMVTLKMNTLIIWNDYVPVNIDDVIKYAHENGVKIYLGFAWGWDTSCDKNSISDTSELTKSVVDKYKSEYAELNCDGIYFQSFTELSRDDIDGVNIAEAVTDFVNNTAREIYQISPELSLLFGLHATSVKNRLDAFKKLDSRISIIWEDMGAFPYHNSSDGMNNFDETLMLNRKVQELRQSGFGAVLKGNYRLDWGNFEHQSGPYIMGVCNKEELKRRTEEIKPLLKKIQADWIINAKWAHELIKDFDEDSMITVLAEDGLFEEILSYPVALYAQMMWDSSNSIEEIMHTVAQMPDVDFV